MSPSAPPSDSIDQLIAGRENNFNLLRFIAASLVIWSHSFALLPNGMATDPVSRVLGFGFAGIAVNSFFAISGFLIVRSYITHDNLGIYLQARVLRIMPGLIVAVLFCALVVGPIFTVLPWQAYLDHPRVWEFISSNIALYNRIPTLPGVFQENEVHGVNGSLWTLSYEVTMYIAVAIVGLFGLLKSRKGAILVCFMYVAYYLFVSGHQELASDWFSPHSEKYQRLSLYFFLGGALYVFREKISLNGSYTLGLWTLAIIAYKSVLFNFMFTLALSYSIFWLALVPKGRLLHFNNFDDYSYGIYIYAFPVQQSLIAQYNFVSEVLLFCISFLITLALAWISCKFVEKPALVLNRKLTRKFYAKRALRSSATNS